MNTAALLDKRILIIGLGVTGASVARHLARAGLAFCVADSNAASANDSSLPSGTAVHHDIAEAILAFAPDVIVLSPGIPRATPAIAAAAERGIPVIGDIELFAGAVTRPVVAVTGSNGKSTVVAWLAHALQAAGIRAVACGNIGVAALDALPVVGSDPTDVYVLELSSYQLESTTSLQPLVAIVLNVSDDHLDRYASMEAYAATKRHVYLGASHRVVNADDARTQPATALSDGDALLSRCSLPSEMRGKASNWHIAANDDAHWLCRDHERRFAVSRLRPPGEHNALNALAVLALAEPVLAERPGAQLDDLYKGLYHGLASWRGLPHRTELIAEQGGVRWYDDSKGTNVDACVKAIDAMPGPVILIAGGIGKGADFTPLAAPVQARVKLAILIGRDAASIRNAIMNSTEVRDASSLEDAVEYARASARSGDVVLLSPACSSFDMFANYLDRGVRFQAAVRQESVA